MSARTSIWKRATEQATLEFALLTPLALACIFTNRLLPIAALIAGLALAWRAVRNLRAWAALGQGWRSTLRLNRLAPFASLLMLMLGVSTIITIDPSNTNAQVQRVLLGLATCLALRDWASVGNTLHPDQRRWLLQLGLIGLGSALALASPFVVEWQSSKLPTLIPSTFYQRFPLLTSDGANPNVMAGSLLILWPLALAPLLRWPHAHKNEKVTVKQQVANHTAQTVESVAPPPTPLDGRGDNLPAPTRMGQRWGWSIWAGYLLATVLIFAMLVLTQSRGAWLGALAAIALLLNLRWRWARWLSGLSVVVALLIAIAQPAVLGRFTESLSTGGGISGSAERIEIWTHAGYMIQDFSFTGVGMGNFHRVNELFYPLYVAPPDAPHAHNLFLQVAVDLGLPGLLAWLGIFGHSLRTAIRAYRRANSADQRALAAGIMAAQLALAVHGLLDCSVWGVMRTALMVWLVWGLSLALPTSASPSLQPERSQG